MSTPSGLSLFKWWYKGRTPDGNTMQLEGEVVARDHWAAQDKVEKAMRAKHPTVKWMQRKRVEGNGVTFGPTTQLMRAYCREAGRAFSGRDSE